jgi:hypothetical protein
MALSSIARQLRGGELQRRADGHLRVGPNARILRRKSLSCRELVSRIFASWNQLDGWLRQAEGLRRVA